MRYINRHYLSIYLSTQAVDGLAHNVIAHPPTASVPIIIRYLCTLSLFLTTTSYLNRAVLHIHEAHTRMLDDLR